MEGVEEKEPLRTLSPTEQKLDIMDVTGGDGPWQRSILVFVFLLHAITAFHVFSMSFLAPNLDHWCARPPELGNFSVEQWRSIVMPPEDQRCSRFVSYSEVCITLWSDLHVIYVFISIPSTGMKTFRLF